jgi:hypothetical protein
MFRRDSYLIVLFAEYFPGFIPGGLPELNIYELNAGPR